MEAINDNVPVIALLLDMSKAFDFVDHKLLLHKLDMYGIRGRANEWIQSYLSNRQQCVEIAKVHMGSKTTVRSSYKYNRLGVPQGSILGPFLFLMYINDIPNITRHKTILFADDTTIIIRDDLKNNMTFEIDINNTLSNTIQWLNNNNLKINLNKTNFIQFRTYKQSKVDVAINYNNTQIAEVDTAKFLGIWFDQHCNWKTHVKNVCDRLDKFVYAIKSLRLRVSIDAALKAYHGYVSSTLAYGLIMWGNSCDIEKAFITQKKCVRAICGAWNTDSCKPLFKKFNILPLPCMYIMDICLFVKQYPCHFNKRADVLERQSRHKDKLYVPKFRVKLIKKNVFHQAINIYNKLPKDLQALSNNLFKIKLRLWLMDKCFYNIKEFLEIKT